MADNAYFSGNPVKLDISRSRMTAQPRWTGHWKVGTLVPIFARQVLPGETMKMSVNSAIRMITPVLPVMDDMDITIEAFYVPNRLLLSRQSFSPSTNDSAHSWEAFIGAQDSLLNMPTPSDVKLPACYIDTQGYKIGGLADCLGFPKPNADAAHYEVNCLKALAYYSIWNCYWREPNTQSPVTFNLGNVQSNGLRYVSFYGLDAGIPNDNYRENLSFFPLAGVSRYHGLYGSSLPWPQRNSTTVLMPLGGSAPVLTGSTQATGASDQPALLWKNGNSDVTNMGFIFNEGTPGTNLETGATSPSYTGGIWPSNLFADLSQATAASVNQFRLAVQTQRWYEALARSGNKYPDLIAGMFDVRNELGLSRPEYLGGFTAPIQMSQVAATNATHATSGGSETPTNRGLGAVGAFSLSNPGGFLFSKSFTEHGIVMVVATCRVKESFAQGLQREDDRFDRFDFYWPQFANLGEESQPVKRLFITGNASADNVVFGYQEAWADERMIADQVTGRFRPGQNMVNWTYVNNFTSAPTLKGYLDARPSSANVDRTLTVSSTNGDVGFQLFGQFEFDITMVKPMPLYSIPGLVDHH